MRLGEFGEVVVVVVVDGVEMFWLVASGWWVVERLRGRVVVVVEFVSS